MKPKNMNTNMNTAQTPTMNTAMFPAILRVLVTVTNINMTS
jgi:hypothetical protein